MVIITADHTRIAAHMRAIKYLILDFHLLSLSDLFALNMESIWQETRPMFVRQAEASPEGFPPPVSFLGLVFFFMLGRRLYNLGLVPLTLIYS